MSCAELNAGSTPNRFRPKNIARAAMAAGLAASCLLPAAASAQEAAATQAELRLELNAVQPSDRGCRFTFMATNGLGGELTSVAFELVLFDKAGMVSRMTVVDFKDLPQGKTKVRQFDFPSVDCTALGRVLINDATECAGQGIEPKACIRGLDAVSRADGIEFGT